jgi:cytochrome c55X
MPSFQGVLSEEQIAALIAYLSGGEKQVPPEIAAAGPVASLFWDKCSGCHGDSRQGGVGPALIPERLSDTDKELLGEVISDGRPGTAMPPWQGTLTGSGIRPDMGN